MTLRQMANVAMILVIVLAFVSFNASWIAADLLSKTSPTAPNFSTGQVVPWTNHRVFYVTNLESIVVQLLTATTIVT